ncbi:MAG TPA: chorismate mutase [Micromonosporaceae bacterium]
MTGGCGPDRDWPGRPPCSCPCAATTVRAVRGAIQVDRDDHDVVLADTATLLREVIRRNELDPDDIISILFSLTPDLVSAFPATAARRLGLADVPVLCASEIDVPGALPRVVRLLAHVRTDRAPSAVEHVYLRGAASLRPDLVQRRVSQW